MTPQGSDSAGALRDEILAEAGREGDEILRRARAEAASILAAAEAEANRIRREKRATAQAEAARHTKMVLATIPVEAERLRSERIESILENIHQEIRRRLLAGDFDRHETVVALAAEAVQRMIGANFILKISPADHIAFGRKLSREIEQRVGRSLLELVVLADETVAEGGVKVQGAEGRRIWDNRLLPRLERLWPELRRQIALQSSLVAQNGTESGLIQPDASLRDQSGRGPSRSQT